MPKLCVLPAQDTALQCLKQAQEGTPEGWLGVQLLVEDMSALMRSVALHNAPLLHQHSCRRMDSGAVAVREQVPPPGFYKSILVRPSRPLHSTVPLHQTPTERAWSATVLGKPHAHSTGSLHSGGLVCRITSPAPASVPAGACAAE